MATVMIADFSGMVPLRDPLLLPDNNAQDSVNTWLYRGQIRGFRTSIVEYQSLYADTEQVYRIPLDASKPFDFTTTGSLWMEFPDPFMSVIRNPTVGDQFDRYYFFPSDQYKSTGVNPIWPVTSPGPVYNTFARLKTGDPMYALGLAPPDTLLAPTVKPPQSYVVYNTNAPSLPGYTVLQFQPSTLVGVTVGMYVIDLSDHRRLANTNATSAKDTSILHFSSTGTAPNDITVGMSCICVNNPSAVFSGSKVSAVTPTSVTISYSLDGDVAAGDQFQFDNANQIVVETTATKVDNTAGQVTINTAVTSAGVNNGDTIQFLTSQPETRAYLYTMVSDFSEESPPSPATVRSGDGAGTWVVTIPQPPSTYAANRPFTPGHFRLYRTVIDSAGNATYYQVIEVPINPAGDVTISDSATSASIVGNQVLDTIGYTPPPANLQGVVMMANGIAAGFTNDRNVWFSAAYLPYAWPGHYALTVDYPVVGLTVNGSSLNIVNEGSPFIATGVTPDTMTIGKITANEPCIGRGSIVSSNEGALYASPNGIIQLSTGGTINITEKYYEKEFHNSLHPDLWAGGKFGSAYTAFLKGIRGTSLDTYVTFNGFVFDDASANCSFSYVLYANLEKNVYNDDISGQLFVLRNNGQVVQWNPPISDPHGPAPTTLLGWTYRTKKYRYTSPQQFAAFMVMFNVPSEVQFTPGVRNTDQAQVYDPTTQWLIAKVFADGRLVVVREVQKSGEVLSIPGGFKAEVWEVQLEGIVAVTFFKMASSIKELKAA